ncbi:MAG: hypothetical protein ACR2RB_13510, partial [Gammaproteobacteria bacterium]
LGGEMKYYAVLRLIPDVQPTRMLKEISKLSQVLGTSWMYDVNNIHDEHSAHGFVHVFTREGQARQLYHSNVIAGADGDDCSVYLICCHVHSQRAAAEAAIQTILYSPGSRGSVLASFVNEEEGLKAA